MSGAGLLSTDLLVQKLQNLSGTQQSVEALSAWCMFFRKEIRKIVEVWKAEFQKAGSEKHIAFLYLANDLLQNGRKKAPEIGGDFFRVLPECLKTVQRKGTPKDVQKAKRLVTVWGERQVYSSNAVKQLLSALGPGDETIAANPPSSKRARVDAPPVKGLQNLTTAMVDVGKVEAASNKALLALNGPCRNQLEVDGTMEELLGAEKPLVAYTVALKAEITVREQAVKETKALLLTQERSIASAQQKLGLSKEHLEKVRARMELLREPKPAGAQPDAPAAEPAGEEEYDPENP